MSRTFASCFSRVLDSKLIEELSARGIVSPTEVQEKAIPRIVARQNSIVVAPTGSGKTVAYCAPLVELLRREAAKFSLRPSRPSALVVVPSRELAVQVTQQAKQLAKAVGKLRVECAAGGVGARRRLTRDVKDQMVDLLVCSPGVFLKMRDEQQLFSSDVRHVVFDEADTLFGKGFLEDIDKLMVPVLGMGKKLQQPRHVVAVGAAMPEPIVKRIARVAMDCTLTQARDLIIRASGSHAVPTGLKQQFLRVAAGDKMPYLLDALASVKWSKCLIFVNTPDCARAVEYFLRERGFDNIGSFHRDVPGAKREQALQSFRSAEAKNTILVSTDAASRGLDVEGLDLVVNFDFPLSATDYLHRVGRTARMGRKGHTISLVQTKGDRAISKKIEELQASSEAKGDLTTAIEESNLLTNTDMKK